MLPICDSNSSGIFSMSISIFLYKWLCFFKYCNKLSINLGITGSNNACPSYAAFLLSLTIITPLLSADLGRELQLLSISEMGMLHILPFTFADWPFGITVTFLNVILFATRPLSNRRRSRNSFGNNSTANLLETAWQGTLLS